MATSASLSIKLGLITATFAQDTAKARASIDQLQRGVENLGKQFSGLTGPLKQFGGLVAGLGLVSLVSQTIALADSVSDLAKGFSISAATVLQFKEALVVAGGDGNKFEQMLSKLYTAIDKAQAGDEVLIGKFQKLGISFKELSQLTPEEALKRVTKALGDNASGFEKVALARELFGKSAAGIDFGKLGEELEKSQEKQLRYAYNLERIKDLHDIAAQSLVNLQIAFSSFIPEVAKSAVTVETFEKILRALVVYFAVTRVLAFAGAIAQITVGIRGATTAVAAFNVVAGPKSPMGIIITGIGLAIAGAIFLLDEFSGKVDKLGGGTGEAPKDEGFEAYKKKQEEEEKARKIAALATDKKNARGELVAAEEKYAATVRQIALENGRLQVLANIGLVSERERKFIDINLESGKKLNDLEKQKADINKQYANKPDILKQELATVGLLIEAEKGRAQQIKDAYDNELKLSYLKDAQATRAKAQFERGRNPNETPEQRARGEVGFKEQEEIRTKVGAEPEEGYSEAQLAVIAAIKERSAAELELLDVQEARVRMQQVLTNTEQAAFSEFGRNLQALGQKNQAAFIAYKAYAISQAIIDTYKSATSSYAALSPIPFIGPALGVAAAAVAIAAGLARVSAIRSQQPSGRQAGGPVTGGTPYTVGEAGREIFVPAQSGAIIPNGKTEQMMKGGGATFNITVNPGASFDEKVMQTILGNLKQLSGSLVDENQRRFSPSYSTAGV